MEGYRTIAISCKAKNLLDELMKLNPEKKKFVFVSNLIEEAYEKMTKHN
jgi:hypothetical protein